MPWPKRFTNLFHRDRLARRIEDEFTFHLRERIDELIEQGYSPAEARSLAHRQFGNLTLQQERTVEMNIVGWLESVAQDLQYALRTLRQSPGFTAVAVLTLALGIGANAALFSVVNAVFFRPLPYPEADRLVTVWEANRRTPSQRNITSAPNFADWRQRNHVFTQMALYEGRGFNVVTAAGAVSVPAARVSAELFPLLGVAPALGRTPTNDEERAGNDRVAVLSHAFWQEHFGGDRGVLGQTFRMNSDTYIVIGVMPPHFHFPWPVYGIWVPLGLNENDQDRGSHSFQVLARLKPGVTLAQASAEMETIGRTLAREYPVENSEATVALIPMSELDTVSLRPVFAALLGAVGFVLLIAAANLANLLLARGTARQRELALRTALGAGKGRLLRQLLTESLLLAGLGCAAGLLMARLSLIGLAQILPGNVKYVPFRDMETLSIDGRVLLFSIAVSLLAGMLFGLAPALQARGVDLAHTLKQGGRGAIGRGGRFRQLLIAAEVALALVVLTGAGLLTRSLALLVGVDPGLNPKNVLVMNIALPQADFYGLAERKLFCQQTRDALAQIPGVTTVSAISNLPFTGSDAGRSFMIEGRPEPLASERPYGRYSVACPDYFRSLQIPLVQGREFEDRDSASAAQAVILNESLAKRYWPGENPVGRRIRLGRPTDPTPWLTIIGVVRDTRRWGFDSEVRPELFRPYSQAAWPRMTFVVRTAGDPLTIVSPARAAASRIDAESPVFAVRTMESVLDGSVGPRRFPLYLLSAFSVLALALAAVGIFGVVSYLVAQRTQEIGLRLALGAGRRHILNLILRRSLPPVGIGILAGLAASLSLTRLLDMLLFEVRPSDPIVLGGVTATLVLVGLLATLIPAGRATQVDPAVALRQE